MMILAPQDVVLAIRSSVRVLRKANPTSTLTWAYYPDRGNLRQARRGHINQFVTHQLRNSQSSWNPLLAESSWSLPAINAKLGNVTRRRMGSAVMEYTKGDSSCRRKAPHRFPFSCVYGWRIRNSGILIGCCLASYIGRNPQDRVLVHMRWQWSGQLLLIYHL